MTLPTSDELNRLLRYDADSGFLYWRKRTPDMFNATAKRSAEWTCKSWNTRFAGKPALNCLDTHGYCHGSIYNKLYQAHRVIWCMIVGTWPVEIDHENGDPDDNRFENLRDVSHVENQRNQKNRTDNTSGHMGVHWNKQLNKWEARIKTDGRKKHLGLFTSLDDAIAARKAAERQYGFHNNHGR